MKKLLLLACLLLTLSCSEDIPVSTSDTVEIYGIVSNSEGFPLSNVLIKITSAVGNGRSVITGDDGYYQVVITQHATRSSYTAEFSRGNLSRTMHFTAVQGDKIELNMRF